MFYICLLVCYCLLLGFGLLVVLTCDYELHVSVVLR